ncbi:SDR family oxidoreductase [Burkholderia sp. R-69980]|nr:SDR family oxidoreductase [Burkholderia sp. R-69980]
MTNGTHLPALFSLAGKMALVTGASSGLGRHFARTLGRAGAEVIVAARRADKLSDLVDELRADGIEAHALSMDVTRAGSVRHAFDAIEELGGPARIVVNNAGVTVTRTFLEQTEEDWDHVLGTNLKGAWLVNQEAARRLVGAQRTGSIVNIASILGVRVAAGVAPYSISKAALIQATKAAALELARHGICVNALLPGYIVTDLNADFLGSEAGERLRGRIPTRHFGQPEDLDGPLLLLASEAGRHMTGATLAVDGGHLISSL